MLIPHHAQALQAIHHRVLPALMIAAVCSSLSGCGDSGPKRVSVAGTVTLDGHPLPKGVIQFTPIDRSGPMVSVSVESGKFEVSRALGPTAGSSQVDVLVMNDLGFPLDDDVAYAEVVKTSNKPISPTPARPPAFADDSQRTLVLDRDRADLSLQLHTR
jgi:hypothetical protein